MGLLKDVIDLFGGFRFCHMDLFQVDGMRLLLGACAKTLESVVLDPTDPRGERLSPTNTQIPANDSTAKNFLSDFDLSRNESLRTLKLPASSLDRGVTNGLDIITFFKRVLPTITSSAFFEVVVIYGDRDFRGVRTWSSDRSPFYEELSQAARAEEFALHRRKFDILREVNVMRAFQLVLCASVWGCVGKYPVQMLKEAVAGEKAKGGFCGCFSPLVVYDPRGTRDGF